MNCERKRGCRRSTHSDSRPSSHSRSSHHRSSSRSRHEASVLHREPSVTPPVGKRPRAESYSGHKSPPVLSTNSCFFEESFSTLAPGVPRRDSEAKNSEAMAQ